MCRTCQACTAPFLFSADDHRSCSSASPSMRCLAWSRLKAAKSAYGVDAFANLTTPTMRALCDFVFDCACVQTRVRHTRARAATHSDAHLADPHPRAAVRADSKRAGLDRLFPLGQLLGIRRSDVETGQREDVRAVASSEVSKRGEGDARPRRVLAVVARKGWREIRVGVRNGNLYL